MFLEIFLFELTYRRKRAATYLYFGIIFFVCFLTAASPTRSSPGGITANAPYLIANITALMSLLFTMITSGIMATAIIRDFEHNTEAILFTTPIRKADYLLGRFTGSFVILVLINCAGWLGLMSGFSLGKFMPWDTTWKDEIMLPFNTWHYLQPFLVISFTNLFTTGSLYFMSGALGRNAMVIYTQAIVLLLLYQMGFTLVGNIDSKPWAAIIDPFGIQTIQYVTRYWTPVERDTMIIPVEGIMLYNRLLWLGVGLAALIISLYAFSFGKIANGLARKKRAAMPETEVNSISREIPVTQIVSGRWMELRKLVISSLLHVKMISREVPFIAFVFVGILLVAFNTMKMTDLYGSDSYPTVYSVLRVLSSFNISLFILAIFYPGELVWRERTVGFAPILDAMPVPSFLSLMSKFVAMFILYVILLFALAICGVLVQMAHGYFSFHLPVYLLTLFSGTLVNLILYTALSFFVHVMVNEKFLAFTLCIAFLIVNALLNRMGLEHDLWQFGSGTLGTFSDMNWYGHFIVPFTWFKLYWLGFVMTLFAIAVVLSVRGSEALMRLRWKSGKLRITHSWTTFTLASISLFALSGSYIYYNTSVLNTFESSNQIEARRAKYEKAFKQYEFLAQPKIVESNLKVDIHPVSRDFDAEGFYYLKNKSNQPIQQLHIQENTDRQLTVNYVRFDRPAVIQEDHPDFDYQIYNLSEPLQPGDSLKMSFQLTFRTQGFEESGSNTDIVGNGTFFNNTYFPSLGYNDRFELSDNSQRRKQGLKVKDQMLDINDPRGNAINVFGDDADLIRFEMTVSTDADQIAVAPGYLQRAWTQGGRKYFHYRADAPMSNFYSIVSARYGVKLDTWHDVKLEIYYHPGHEFNLERMMKAMKGSLDYYAANFSPFQYRQLRIVEFPRYTVFAQSFANTIPFSEGIGFILKVNHPSQDLDMAYYVTAHEVAHQWWGHQVMEAKVKGSGMLSESMAQYSALMVMQRALSREAVGRYLKYELDSYLAGRASEKRREVPLYLAEEQNYIHYNKASLIFYALQDYVGEERINKAFRNYNREWAFKGTFYPTSKDLLRHLRTTIPDSLQYLIHDMFETITFFENKSLDAVYEEKPSGGYEVTLKTSCEKIRVDSVGRETGISLHDWIDIGVFAGERLIYLKKHLIDQKEMTFTLHVQERPTGTGIDPLHKLIDRHTNDNTMATVQLVEISGLPVD